MTITLKGVHMNRRIYDYWVATLQDGYMGNLVELTERAGGAEALYEMSAYDLTEKLGISVRLDRYIREHRPGMGEIAKGYESLAKKGINYIDHTDDDFPQRLREIPSPPYALFVKGRLPDEDVPSVAIVGARQCSEYGRLSADYLGSRLAKEGVQVISGMAVGIDGLAMEAALSAGGSTFGVLGCGVDIPYPSKNRQLYEKLCAGSNGVISEYAPGTCAEPRRFPPRNRLISGLCDVLIVVEARAKSGTLITVDMAIDQGREVMVVPGRLTDDLSTGCLRLLYQGAHPVISIESVMEHLGPKRAAEPVKINKRKKTAGTSDSNRPIGSTSDKGVILPEEMRKVFMLLTIDPQSTEQIALGAAISVSEAMIILSRLEMMQMAREIWPGYFVRHVTAS